MSRKPILCLDFDGVVHSYSSGWKGADVIPDPPVDGAIAFMLDALVRFDVVIFSSRSNQLGGIAAMRAWLKEHAGNVWYESPLGPGLEDVRFSAEKPPALVTIDDRAVTFTGIWPSLDSLAAFTPWNKRAAARGIGAEGQDAQRLGAEPAEPGAARGTRPEAHAASQGEREAMAAEVKRLRVIASKAAVAACFSVTPQQLNALTAAEAEVDAAIDRLAAVTPPTVPEGWKLVPVEPTTEMLKAAEAAWLRHGAHAAQFPLAQGFDKGLPRCWQLELSNATHVFRAMLSAAPAASPPPPTAADAGMAPPEAEGAVLTDEQITAMLQELDEICRQHDVYEYGLPLGFDQPDFGITPHAKMIAAVRAAIDASRRRAGS